MEKGTHKPCIQANIIQDKEAKLNKEELTSISLTMLSGGLDTVTTLVAWSIALLGQRPDIQDKAIYEIRKMFSEDEILCAPEDDMKCVYVMALVKECLRYTEPTCGSRYMTDRMQILYSATISSSPSNDQGYHIRR
jgi:3-hydroxyphenylacetate 6-hydroxylase